MKLIIEKAEELVGYKPKTEFKQGLADTIKWFRENRNKIEKTADFPPGMSSTVRDAKEIIN